MFPDSTKTVNGNDKYKSFVAVYVNKTVYKRFICQYVLCKKILYEFTGNPMLDDCKETSK